jgi:hypothetical protein
MKTLPRRSANELWNKWWDEMQDEWFKVEVLQDYAAEDEGPSLIAWLKGDKQRSIELMKEDQAPKFTKNCQEKLKQGVKLHRIHVIQKPYAPYIAWEIEFYRRVSIPLRGESVYLLNRSDTTDLELPVGDVMIFDKKRVVVNTYNQRGLMTHQTFHDEVDDIGRFLELRKMLIERAKPL